jgi:NAD(P)-dependent dehydrogenase (short-subunit alcohol dehydrogenase family)
MHPQELKGAAMSQRDAERDTERDVQEFAGLRALVTGGASGIGLAVAERLHAQGCRVAVLDLETSGVDPRFLAVACDVADSTSVSVAVTRVAEEFAGLDVVINNAGIGAQGTVEENPDEEWRRVFEVNVYGVVRVTRSALPFLRRSPHAAIVNTCSVAADIGLPRRALYSATKGAVLALTRAMAADHLAEGIRVNCVNPGTADTPWVQRLLGQAADPEAELKALAARQPHHRLVTAPEIAGAIVYLASPLSGSTTGIALNVDGGLVGLRVPQKPA